jgi:hypothetical protein
MEKYISRVFIAFSILLNAIVGGKNNQTLSAGQWQRKRAMKMNFVRVIDTLFWWEPNHCEDAWIKWQIINHAIDQYDGIAEHYYSGIKKKKKKKK